MQRSIVNADFWADPSCLLVQDSTTLQQRAQWAVSRLNRAIQDVSSAPEWNNRVRFVTINSAFKGHEGAAPNCGGSTPLIDDTYIQYPDFGIEFWSRALHQDRREQLLKGSDCIHPNDAGAQVYANGSGSVSGVFDAAQRLLPLSIPKSLQQSPQAQEDARLSVATTQGGDCCTAHDSPSCAVNSCAACVCAPDSACCDTAWNTFCVEDAKTVCAEAGQCGSIVGPTNTPAPTATPGGDCMATHSGPGCDTPQCQSCVCGGDLSCCTGTWDDFCVAAALGSCAPSCVAGVPSPTPTTVPTPGGDCCVAHVGAGCDSNACQSCVCDADPDCCANSWDQFCLNLVGDTCASSCVCAPNPTLTPQPTDTPIPTPTGVTPTPTSTVQATPTAGGDCCARRDGRGCDATDCQSCVCGTDVSCCTVGWNDRCLADAAGTCASACSCALLGTPILMPSQTNTPTQEPTPIPIGSNTPTASATPIQTAMSTPSFTAGTSTATATSTNTPTKPATITATPTPTETPPAAGVCIGDCDGNGQVTVDEILTMVNIAVGKTPITKCDADNANHDDQITIDKILTAVNNALNGCP